MGKYGEQPGTSRYCTHNLKVIGSNPIPATRKELVNSTSWRAFSCSNLPQWSDHGPIQEMLMNTRLSHAVAWCAGSSVSQIWHMKSGALFVKRSCIDGWLSLAALSHIQAGFGIGRQSAQGRARHQGLFCAATPGSRQWRGR